MDFDDCPEEILLRIFKHFDELPVYFCASNVCKIWNTVAGDDVLWRRLYKKKWLTNVFPDFLLRTWKTKYRDRFVIETKRIGLEKLREFEKRELDEVEKSHVLSSLLVFSTFPPDSSLQKRARVVSFALMRTSRFIAIGDALRDNPDIATSDAERLLVAHVAHENYASSIAQSPKNYVGYFSWGYIVHSIAKSFPKAIDSSQAFRFCFTLYEAALAIPENGLKDDTLSRWGDALHDYAKTHKSKREIISNLELSYEKFALAVTTNSDSFLARDYWGLALFTHAKLLKPNTTESDEAYLKCYDQFRAANDLKPRDGYVLCHWATSLQQQAMAKEYAAAKPIYQNAFSKFQEASTLLSQDAFVFRSWADALHDCAKKIIHVAESETTDMDTREKMLSEAGSYLEEASARFQAAVDIRKDYSNALNNWGLSLSTHAKFLPETAADDLFERSYLKFADALSVGKEESYIVCNWGMTLINHARKKAEFGKTQDYRRMMEAAYEKFRPLIFNEKNPDPWSWFCVARWASVDHRYEECREWLEKFQSKDNYIPRATKGQMNYFRNVEKFDWFQSILEKSRRQDPDFIEIT